LRRGIPMQRGNRGGKRLIRRGEKKGGYNGKRKAEKKKKRYFSEEPNK